MNIREEGLADHAAIRAVNQAAFGTSEEADLIDVLRADGSTLLSLVAGAPVAGHILFSRMWIAATPTVALAPVAVEPEQQCQGIGSQLIRHGLQLLRERGERIVIVVGHPAYYPRFGFSQEKAAALEHTFSREAFMALELVPGALEGVSGPVTYPPAFGI